VVPGSRQWKCLQVPALAKEATGGDNLAVGARLPDGSDLSPIPVEGYLFLNSWVMVAARATRDTSVEQNFMYVMTHVCKSSQAKSHSMMH